MSESTSQILSVFLYTMCDYERITRHLPVSEGLQAFDNTSNTIFGALAEYEADSAAIDVRLMLQRKYFQSSEALHWNRLLRCANDCGVAEAETLERLSNQMGDVHAQPIELALTDGTLITKQFSNAEDIVYGSLLHSDVTRLNRSIRFPFDLRLLSLAGYVLAREELLLSFRDLCVSAGIKPFDSVNDERAPILRWQNSNNGNRSIQNSPYWSNLIGRDADISDLKTIAHANSLDDNVVLLTAMSFLSLLQNKPLDYEALRLFVWDDAWKERECLESVAEAFVAIENPGISTRIFHDGGINCAQVRIFQRVDEPWITDVPQILPRVECMILFSKRGNAWKIDSMVFNGSQ